MSIKMEAIGTGGDIIVGLYFSAGFTRGRADWVLGVARLISSTRTTCAIIGPGLNSKSEVLWLKI